MRVTIGSDKLRILARIHEFQSRTMVDLSGKEYYHHLQMLPTMLRLEYIVEIWRLKYRTVVDMITGKSSLSEQGWRFLINHHSLNTQAWHIREIPTVSSSFRECQVSGQHSTTARLSGQQSSDGKQSSRLIRWTMHYDKHHSCLVREALSDLNEIMELPQFLASSM